MSYVPLGLNLASAALIDIICSAALTRPREFPLYFPGSTKVDLIYSKEGAVIHPLEVNSHGLNTGRRIQVSSVIFSVYYRV